MRIIAIRENLVDYKSELKRTNRVSAIWEIHQNFNKYWNLSSDSPSAMYEQSLHSQISRAFWVGNNYLPKEMMSEFLKLQPEMAVQAFRELFDEDKDLIQRLDKFIFYCDQLLELYKKSKPGAIENNHFHDYRILSIYLCLKYPGRYVPYRFKWLQGVCKVFEARPYPEVEDPERYFKIARIAHRFMQEDEDLKSSYTTALEKSGLNFDEPFDTLFPAAEFCAYCSGETMP